MLSSIRGHAYRRKKAGFLQNVFIYDSSNAISDNYTGSKLLQRYELDTVKLLLDASITVNTEGLIAVVLAQNFKGTPRGKLIVIEQPKIFWKMLTAFQITFLQL